MSFNTDNYKNYLIDLNTQFSDCCEMRDLLAKIIFKNTCNKEKLLADIHNSDCVSNIEKKNMLDFAYTQKFISLPELENCYASHPDIKFSNCQ